VPADSAVSLRFGLTSATPSQARSIVAAMVVYVAIDASGAIVAGTFGAPVATGDQWVTTWTYDTGHTLASGQSMTVSVAPYATRKVWDGSRDVNNKPLKFGPGFVFFGQGTSCTITAS
jgi:hypothetical protein